VSNRARATAPPGLEVIYADTSTSGSEPEPGAYEQVMKHRQDPGPYEQVPQFDGNGADYDDGALPVQVTDDGDYGSPSEDGTMCDGALDADAGRSELGAARDITTVPSLVQLQRLPNDADNGYTCAEVTKDDNPTPDGTKRTKGLVRQNSLC